MWTSRPGFESFLASEVRGQVLEPGLVFTSQKGGAPAFGRMGFELKAVHGFTETPSADWFPTGPLHLQAWTVDSDLANRHAGRVSEWAGHLSSPDWLATPEAARQRNAWLGQLCVGAGLFYVGAVRANEAVSLAPGGRHRMRRPADAPSRAAMKVEEALEWLGYEPSGGEVCVDLGAAPGGWTQRLVARGSRVIAVDPAKLTPELSKHKKVKHVLGSAFSYAPDEPVDWLFCDMAWRPLEVAQLIGKWGRNRWATMVVANFKLPMKDKLPMIARITQTLQSGGWKSIKVRQLYHDRDEVTVTARGGP